MSVDFFRGAKVTQVLGSGSDLSYGWKSERGIEGKLIMVNYKESRMLEFIVS